LLCSTGATGGLRAVGRMGRNGSYANCKRAIAHSNSHLIMENPVDRCALDHLRALWVIIV